MNRNQLLVGLAGVIIGGLLVGLIAAVAVNSHNTRLMQAMGMRISATSSSMTMDDMVSELQGKSGDAFDQAFISGMIEHHQGAIDMAKLATNDAKHQELKDLAVRILAAQSEEIDLMQAWQTDWGYKQTPMSHDGMH